MFLVSAVCKQASNTDSGSLDPTIVAVLAFKAVYTLEMKRSENDSKVIALYVEMKYMMTVLLQ